MQVDPRLRTTVRRVAARLGVETLAQRAYERIDPTARIDRLANEHTRLLLAFSLRIDSNCIDVGAHTGAILQEMVRCAPHGHHIAYEPIPGLAERLAQTFPQVDVRNAALSDRPGETDFYVVPNDPMQSGLKARDDGLAKQKVRVKVETLDESLPTGYVPHVIKIDVEGAEQRVLEGARRTIAEHRPLIVFEHGAGLEDQYGTSPGALYDLLTRAGLRIFDIEGDGPYSRDQFVGGYHKPIWNFVAHP